MDRKTWVFEKTDEMTSLIGASGVWGVDIEVRNVLLTSDRRRKTKG
jgi:hypothetical protein